MLISIINHLFKDTNYYLYIFNHYIKSTDWYLDKNTKSIDSNVSADNLTLYYFHFVVFVYIDWKDISSQSTGSNSPILGLLQYGVSTTSNISIVEPSPLSVNAVYDHNR